MNNQEARRVPVPALQNHRARNKAAAVQTIIHGTSASPTLCAIKKEVLMSRADYPKIIVVLVGFLAFLICCYVCDNSTTLKEVFKQHNEQVGD